MREGRVRLNTDSATRHGQFPEPNPGMLRPAFGGGNTPFAKRTMSLCVNWMRHTEPNPQPRAGKQWCSRSYPRSSVPQTLHPELPAPHGGQRPEDPTTLQPTPDVEGLPVAQAAPLSPASPKLHTSAAGNTSPCLSRHYMSENNMLQRPSHASCRRGGRARSHLRGCALAT